MKTITLILLIVVIGWCIELPDWDSISPTTKHKNSLQSKNRNIVINNHSYKPRKKRVQKGYQPEGFFNKISYGLQKIKRTKRNKSRGVPMSQTYKYFPLSPCFRKFRQDYKPPTIEDVDTLYQYSLLTKALKTKDENLKQEFLYEWLQYSDSLCATQKSGTDPVVAEIHLLYKAFYEEPQIYFFLTRAVKVFGSYNSIFMHNNGKGNTTDTLSVVKSVLLSELNYANILQSPPRHRIVDNRIMVRIHDTDTNKNLREMQKECFQYDIFPEFKYTQTYFAHGPYDKTLRVITNEMILKGNREPITFLAPEIPLRLSHWGKSYWYITLPYKINGIVFNKSLNRATIKWRSSPSIHGEAKFSKLFGKWIMTSKRWTGME